MTRSKNEKEGKATGKVYAELLCDFMFKRLFGSEANKDVLLSFLNTVLEDVEIVQVDFIPTEHRGLSEEDMKVDELSKPLTTKDKKRQLKGVVFLFTFVPSKVVIKQQPAERGAFAMFF